MMYADEYALLGGDSKRMATTDSALHEIREGLPIAMVDNAVSLLSLTRGELVNLIGVNLRSLQRKKPDDHLTPQQSEHTLAIVSALTNATEYFEDRQTALEWLKTPQVIFGNRCAFDYFDTMTGIGFVNDVLNRMKYGMTA